ncbi:MAG: 16S rRNA (cytidine(1402)-2'-O)-methyltransferase [Anaerolineaceae bacterium]|nr:MAG: 16S rRNA (cytidine(1402)-2'-O)-methyltransferase [Anaerolineaceae bacterium]
MSGKLYLCATPIGNLEDITFRVIKTLNEVDLIAAEDTRHSRKLLNHFDIKTPMTSYHEHNKIEKAKYLVEQLLAGKDIALITDAGTPAISDPGEELVKQAYDMSVQVTSLPGPCALITGLTLSGLSTGRFSFEAFLPSDKKERARILDELTDDTRTLVFYEAPHRLQKTMKELYEALGDRTITIVRELTKIHETVWRTSLTDAIVSYDKIEPKGEYVLIIEGKSIRELEIEKQSMWEEKTIPEHMKIYMDQGQEKKEAMKSVAKDRGITKRQVYQALLDAKVD